MKKEIIKQFHDTFKDSSLFECWDGCERDLTKYISGIYDLAYNLGRKEQAEQTLREMEEYVTPKP